MTKAKITLKKLKNFAKTKKGIALIVIVVLVAGYYLFIHKKAPAQQFVQVISGTITEAVSVTGNTTPINSVSLGFENSGKVARISSAVGQSVYAGQVLAELNTNDLSAQLAQAKAGVDSQIAKLNSLKSGSRPEDIAASQSAYDKTKQDLSNIYAGVYDTSLDSYTKANDAVRTQLNLFFSNAETTNIKLSYISSDYQAQIDSESGRLAVAGILNNWQTELSSSLVFTNEEDNLIQHGLLHLKTVRDLLNAVSKTLEGSSLNSATLTTYKTNLSTAQDEVNIATKNLNTITQNIASQKQTVLKAEAELKLKQAGSTAEDIASQEAQVEGAQASVLSVEAKISNSKIISPISGIVTQFDAKVGQISSSGTTLIAVISNNQFEVDAQVPETDIGKIAVNNLVDMTFDAFSNEVFTGKIFYIDPAQTINQGVVDYKIKVSFDKLDQRMKSGLTSNLTIKTRTKSGALILPQYAILQNDQGTFVQKLIDGVDTNTPVTLGIQDQDGNVEIISGVSQGEQVLNIGLKQ